jgi:hypothetical protein
MPWLNHSYIILTGCHLKDGNLAQLSFIAHCLFCSVKQLHKSLYGGFPLCVSAFAFRVSVALK